MRIVDGKTKLSTPIFAGKKMTTSTIYTGTMPLTELIELLQLVAFIKRRGVLFLQEWAATSSLPEVRDGLPRQIAQEERHCALVCARLRTLGVEEDVSYQDVDLVAAFQVLAAAPQEVEKLAGFYRSLKEYSVARCAAMIALADPETQRVMDDLSDDEERAQRWGESLRLKLSPTPELQRDGNLMRARILDYTAKSRERLARQLQERARQVLHNR
jgi:hypothetical protein